MSKHKPGSMDISAHEKTFAGFSRILARAVITIAAILIFLAIFVA